MKSEGVAAELLYEEYIVKNKRRGDLAKELGIGDDWLKKLLQRFGIKKSTEARLSNVKSTNRNKYGVDYPFQDKAVNKKAAQTIGSHNAQKPKRIKVSPKRFKEISVLNLFEEKEGGRPIIYIEDTPLTQKKWYQKRREKKEINDKQKAENLGLSLSEYITLKRQKAAEKSREVIKSKYGCNSSVSVKLPEVARIAFSSKENLKKFIKENPEDGIPSLSEKLGCAVSTLYERVRGYGLLKEVERRREPTKMEKAIVGLLERRGIRIIQRDREVLNPLEIDIYCPELKLGIEYNGDYWHSSQYKEKNYHKHKSTEAFKKGVFLYHIFEFQYKEGDDYIPNTEKMLENLERFINGEQRREKLRFLKNTGKKTVFSDVATEPDEWFEAAGFECVGFSRSNKHVSKISRKEYVDVYDCGIKIWEKKDNGET